MGTKKGAKSVGGTPAKKAKMSREQRDLPGMDKAPEALEALRKWQETAAKKPLFGEEAVPVQLLIVPKLIPSNVGMSIKRIELPKPFRSEKTTSICVFVKDLDRDRWNADVDKDARTFRDFLVGHKSVPSELIREVISLRQLKREYKTYEAKRKLASAHDLFLCDERVLREVHRNLGKAFQAKTKLPFPVDITEGDVPARLRKALALSALVIRSTSSRCSLQLGHLSQTTTELTANLAAAMTQLAEKFPGGHANLRSLYMSLGQVGAPQLPLYVDFASADGIKMPMPKTEKPIETDELTTLDEADMGTATRVAVYPDGRVDLLDDEGTVVGIPKDMMKSHPDEQMFRNDFKTTAGEAAFQGRKIKSRREKASKAVDRALKAEEDEKKVKEELTEPTAKRRKATTAESAVAAKGESPPLKRKAAKKVTPKTFPSKVESPKMKKARKSKA